MGSILLEKENDIVNFANQIWSRKGTFSSSIISNYCLHFECAYFLVAQGIIFFHGQNLEQNGMSFFNINILFFIFIFYPKEKWKFPGVFCSQILKIKFQKNTWDLHHFAVGSQQ